MHILRDAPPRWNKTLFSTDTWFRHISRDGPISTFYYTIGWMAQAFRETGFTTEVIEQNDVS